MNIASWNVADWAGVAVLVFTVLLGIHTVLIYSLKDIASRKMWADWLERPRLWNGYRMSVSWGLGRLDRSFGREMSWQAFDRCLLLAFGYSFVFFVLGWIAGGPGGFASIEFLPEGLSFRERLKYTAVIFLILGIFIWLLRILIRRRRSLGDAIVGPLLVRLRSDPPSRLYNFLNVVTDVLGFVLSFAGIFALFLAALIAVGVTGQQYGFEIVPVVTTALIAAIVPTGIYVVASEAGSGTLGRSLIVFSFVMLAIQMAIAFVSDSTGLHVVIFPFLALFLVILPVANAALDYLSWAVSRLLIRHVVGGLSHWAIAAHLIADAALAVLFLFLLVVLLVVIVDGANMLFAFLNHSVIDWRANLDAAASRPFSEGMWITGMLLTTLIPTALHLGAAGTALVLRPMPGRQTIIHWLRIRNPPALIRLGLVAWLQVSALGSLILLITACYAIWLAIAQSGTTVGDWLYATALWSSSLVGGPGVTTP